MSVDKDKLTGGPGKKPSLELILIDLARVCREPEWCLRDGGDVGEAPVLIVRRGKADLAEAREGVLAKLAQPGQVVAGSSLLEVAESFQVGL